MFGLPEENVRVITKFLGSGFGGKLWPWTHCPLAAAAARQLGKPVKLVRQPQDDVPDRRTSPAHPAARAPRRDGRGKLVSLQHDYVYTRRSSTTTRKTAARRRRFSTACPICA